MTRIERLEQLKKNIIIEVLRSENLNDLEIINSAIYGEAPFNRATNTLKDKEYTLSKFMGDVGVFFPTKQALNQYIENEYLKGKTVYFVVDKDGMTQARELTDLEPGDKVLERVKYISNEYTRVEK